MYVSTGSGVVGRVMCVGVGRWVFVVVVGVVTAVGWVEVIVVVFFTTAGVGSPPLVTIVMLSG